MIKYIHLYTYADRWEDQIMRKRLLSIVFAAAAMLSLSTVIVFAGNDSSFREVKASEIQKAAIESSFRQSKPANFVADEYGDDIYYTKPTKIISTGYKGEKFRALFNCRDTWSSYKTVPAILITTEDGDYVTTYVYKETEAVKTDSWTQYSIELNLANTLFRSGKNYYVFCLAAPDTGDDILDLIVGDEFDIPTSAIQLNVRTLGRPAKVNLAAGKRNVTVSWSAVTGAYKYQVLRSTSKTKGYTRVATTSSRKFVDKKVKKGKRYYYKVRAVRTWNVTLYGSYTAPKLSGKVR